MLKRNCVFCFAYGNIEFGSVCRRRDSVVNPPLGQNGSRCSKCFCYVCDKLASSCEQWTESNMPHCNAHARASCWKARRSVKKSPVIERLPNDRVTKEITDSGRCVLQCFVIRFKVVATQVGVRLNSTASIGLQSKTSPLYFKWIIALKSTLVGSAKSRIGHRIFIYT